MKKYIASSLLVLLLIGCGSNDSSASKLETNTTTVTDINENNSSFVDIIEDTFSAPKSTMLDLNNSISIVQSTLIPAEGGDVDFLFIPAKDKSLELSEKSILLVKTQGEIQEYSWANVYFDTLREVYVVQGTCTYAENITDKNITSTVSATYVTEKSLDIFKTIEITQLAASVKNPIDIPDEIIVESNDSNESNNTKDTNVSDI